MKKQFILISMLLLSLIGFAQSTLTLKDAVLNGRKFVPQGITMPQWIPGTDLYSHIIDNYQTTVIIDAKTGIETGRITAGQINDALAKGNFDIKVRGTWILEWFDEDRVSFIEKGTLYTYDRRWEVIEKQYALADGNSNVTMGNNLNAAYTVGNNVFVNWNKSGAIEQITNHNNPNIVSGQAIARSEFGITEGLFWNPEGTAIAFYEKDESAVTNYPLLDIESTPGLLQEIKYPMAGQGSEYARVGVFRKGQSKPVYLETDGQEHDQYLTNLSWSPDGKTILLAIVNRAQNHYDVVAFNTKNGKRGKTLFSVDNNKWAEPEYPAFWVSNKEFIWMSEMDSFMNLYLYNTKGEMIQKLTENAFVATEILGRDMSGDILFMATGDDARESHLFSVSLKGKQIQLTSENGYHSATIQEGGHYFIDSYSSVNVPAKDVLMSTESHSLLGLQRAISGKSIRDLDEAADPFEGTNIRKPELGSIMGPDGSILYTRSYKPFDFDPSKKYPVLVYVYGGPHAQMITNRWNGGGPLWMNEFANRGYIVFTIDNRGSAHRGTDFEQQIHRKLGTVEMEDQLAGVAYLKSLPYIDGDRMAVHGWSYGGFMTTSLMLRQPGVFKAGVAGGPVTDWKYYEVMYGERYMDRPEENIEGYASSRLHNYAQNLEGKLLLIHGTVDDVVVMQHNLSLVKAFVDEGIQMDFFPYPMHPHNVRGKDRLHLMTKVLDYVEDHINN
ncbi:MAG: peptidase S9 [Flavobacteriales bacterium]|nr:peptidase S9 [Flavobacteriales bacterium]|tara:strand:+ start:2930 stop:5104 length:2175 start_codon:yes stop_codon:yes gene_type:complete